MSEIRQRPTSWRFIHFEDGKDFIHILDNLANQFHFSDVDYFLATCFFKLTISIMQNINKYATRMYLIDIDCIFTLKYLNGQTSINRNDQIKNLTAKAYIDKGLLDKHIRLYCQLVKDGRISPFFDLIESDFRGLHEDDQISDMVLAYIKNLITEIESPINLLESFSPVKKIRICGLYHEYYSITNLYTYLIKRIS
ncbi:hypothetical protein RF11_07145 [Thelohanellus kitauei]|uniref:Uncharacterized protein n=1 Tax=Thelohanellus kitauei TaxID=669202 RepID=A0A0C2N1U4_THEKT|nr:hypothetical protein RF11_07145 [Thelohanellus kitauei]